MDEKEIKTRLSSLPTSHQVAFLAACVEHISPIYQYSEIVEPLKKAIEIAWNFVSNGNPNMSLAKELDQKIGDLVEADTSSSLIFASTAVRLAALAVESPNNFVEKILNNIEEAVDIIDEEAGEDVGCSEERNWQEKGLALVLSLEGKPISKDLFAELYAMKIDWIERLEAT